MFYIRTYPDAPPRYPYTLTDLKFDERKHTSFPPVPSDEQAAEFGVYPVTVAAEPLYNPLTHELQREEPKLGDDGWTQAWKVAALPPEQAAANVAQARQRKVDEITRERDRRIQNGGFPAAGKWFHSDTHSRSQYAELARRGDNIPPGVPWKTMDKTTIEMTPALVLQILDSAFTHELATFKRGEELRFFANTEPNPDGLVLSGWPPIFGE